MTKRLGRTFFERSTLVVAKELLGKYLVRKINGKEIALPITETEAYHGPKDKASHASRGKTPRTAVMFGPPGHAYIYLIYGMYHCLNIVTGPEEFPSAVLIRGLEGINGPGKLCRELHINKSLNTEDITTSKEIWIEDRGPRKGRIIRTPRVGIDYAGDYKDKLWRFVLESGK
jgi:DNA-3-methyladenine glycosylase